MTPAAGCGVATLPYLDDVRHRDEGVLPVRVNPQGGRCAPPAGDQRRVHAILEPSMRARLTCRPSNCRSFFRVVVDIGCPPSSLTADTSLTRW